MAEIFHLPKMGQTMTEATILKWLKQEGDHVEGWEGVVEMMTDKINMEVEPQITGTLLKILAAEGEVVEVGAPVAIIGSPDEDISGLLDELGGNGASGEDDVPLLSEEAEEAVERLIGGVSEPERAGIPVEGGSEPFPSVSPRAREAASEGGIDWKTLALQGSGYEGMITERDVLAFLESAKAHPEVLATPLAAKIAADLGVSLEALSGSGPGGRVTADDVRKASTPRRDVSLEARRIPLQGMRKVIAQRLSASWQGAVHVPLRAEVDMSAAAELRRQLKPALEAVGARLTYTDLIAAAIIQALVRFPALNATLEDDAIQIHGSVNLGVAVALEEGLTVPVIPDAQNLRLADLSLAIQDTAKKARAGQLPPTAYAGGTITLTNLGSFGVDSFDPIINPPQVAIVGTGRIADRLVPINGQAVARPMMNVTVTFDHRALDGAPAAQFLALVKELLENPARLLL